MKARIAVTVAATVGCVGLIAGAAYAVTVLEWVMPASNLQLGYAAALEYSSRTAELSALDAQAKATHEPTSEPGRAGRRRRPLRRYRAPRQRRRAAGDGPQARQHLRFVYRKRRQVDPAVSVFHRPRHVRPRSARAGDPRQLKRFHARAPGYFDYADSDWKLEGCKSFLTPSTGISSVDVRLRLGSSDVCIVRWLKEPQATMLVGGVVTEGGRWLRYLITPICRLMSIGWLEELAEQGGKADYVACALIFDPDRPAGGPRDIMDRRVYQVTGKRACGHSLARDMSRRSGCPGVNPGRARGD